MTSVLGISSGMWDVKIIDLLLFNSEHRKLVMKSLVWSSRPTQGSSKIMTLDVFKNILTKANFFAVHKTSCQPEDQSYYEDLSLLVLI